MHKIRYISVVWHLKALPDVAAIELGFTPTFCSDRVFKKV
jgi:hypothetical protein